MRKVVLTFGTIAGLIAGGMLFLSNPLAADGTFEGGELLGYSIMIIALSLIFFGVKMYRDKYAGGEVKFGKAFLVGLYITLVACIFYALGWELYLSNTDANVEGFMKTYAESSINRLKESGATVDAINEEKEKAKVFMTYYRKPVFRFGITITEMLPVGILISLISAAILKNKKVLPANNQ